MRPEVRAMKRAGRDIGETLVEVLLTIVLISLTVTALVSSLATTGNAANAQRASVKADYVLRNYAEASKAAAEHCVLEPGYTVPLPTLPPGFSVSSDSFCPNVTSLQPITLTVEGPFGVKTLQIKVRIP
jgi:type II secretory pathway pseudopilin PulG